MADQAGITLTVKFNGENWTTWKFQVEIMLKSKGYFDVVNGTKPRPENDTTEWDKMDVKAQEIIVLRLEEKILTHIITCKNSREMWSKLKAIYEHQSHINVHLLTQKFFTLEYKTGNVTDFISQLEKIKADLKHMGEEISDKMLVTKVLMSLPENMKHFVSAWESTPSDKQTLTDLTSRLMIEEERNKTSEDSMALAVKGKFIKPKGDIKCFNCNKTGHVKKNCPQVEKKCNY
ncbi:Zinc knuckle [Popillia japonica]|uniref:Zinc knuckle n=1 Tax=Popillia japonica TaxID=7064 RepID=A0AAW1LQK8_POPJA